jgi:hypothetical protein
MTTTIKTRKSKFKADPEAAQKKREAAMDKLEQGIESLLNSDRWKQWLTMMSQLRSLSGTRYSWQNCLLLLMQNPDCTFVAGFHDWKKVGRSVKKGAKGLAIRAPFTKKLDEVDDNGENKRITYFNLVHVFDISQTEGNPIPELVSPLQGDDAGLYEALIKSAQLNSMPVFEEELDGMNGYCRFSRDGLYVERIVVGTHLSPLHKSKTLAHELAHGILHKGVDYAEHRPQCELEAESTAFIVLNHFGLDSGEFTFGYLCNWQGENALSKLKESADRIQLATNQIISWIEERK